MAEVTQVQMGETGANAPEQGAVLRFQERPEWVPPKFYKDGEVDIREVVKSYADLEKKMGGQPASQPKQQEPKAETKQTEQPKPQMEGVEIPGVQKESLTKFTEEITKDGKLSQASYDELAKAGYPKAVVDNYIKGLQAESMVNSAVEQDRTNKQESQRIMQEIGGSEAYSEMVGWAADNLPPEAIEAYNTAVQSGDMAKAELAIKGLHAKYKAAVGDALNLLDGDGGGEDSAAKPYGSAFEMTQDINSVRYRNDEGFRQKVAQRIKASKFF